MTDEHLYSSANDDRKAGYIGRGCSHRRAANRRACRPFEGHATAPARSLVDLVGREEVGTQFLPLWTRLGIRMVDTNAPSDCPAKDRRSVRELETTKFDLGVEFLAVVGRCLTLMRFDDVAVALGFVRVAKHRATVAVMTNCRPTD
jgi:hypothetical protein